MAIPHMTIDITAATSPHAIVRTPAKSCHRASAFRFGITIIQERSVHPHIAARWACTNNVNQQMDPKVKRRINPDGHFH